MIYPSKSYPVYKPSGVEWLGEVPAHWVVARLNLNYSWNMLIRVSNPAFSYGRSQFPLNR